MQISIELNQTWKTTSEVSNYFQSLAETLKRIGGDFSDAPKDWHFHIGKEKDEYRVIITHL